MVSTVIPALNEARTIAEAVSAALAHPSISEVIVVDDGSTDGTADIARKAGAIVIVNERNLGKAMAMDAGVKAAKGDIVLFLDGDVVGFTRETLSLVIDPVIQGRRDMSIGILSRKTFWLNRIMHFFPIISGTRAVTKDLWRTLSAKHKRGFMIEIALNHASRRSPKGAESRLIPGTRHVIKEKKYGLIKGLASRARMIWQVSGASFSLYIAEGIAEAFKGSGRAS
jgi:glycosyltransferase involved in cell wall biosynthesis